VMDWNYQIHLNYTRDVTQSVFVISQLSLFYLLSTATKMTVLVVPTKIVGTTTTLRLRLRLTLVDRMMIWWWNCLLLLGIYLLFHNHYFNCWLDCWVPWQTMVQHNVDTDIGLQRKSTSGCSDRFRSIGIGNGTGTGINRIRGKHS